MRRTPVVLQLSSLDCGASALASILQYHGIEASHSELMELAGVSRDGTSIAGLIAVAMSKGLDARAIQCPSTAALAHPVPSILFWGGGHYVVLEAAYPSWVFINDPHSGRRKISVSSFKDQYAGKLIAFSRIGSGDNKSPKHAGQHVLRMHPSRKFGDIFLALLLVLIAVVLGVLTIPEIGSTTSAGIAEIIKLGMISTISAVTLVAATVLSRPVSSGWSAQVRDIARTIRDLPLRTLEILPAGFFLPTDERSRQSAASIWILCALAVPFVAAAGAGHATWITGSGLWAVPLLMVVCIFGISICQRRSADRFVASSGALRLRSRFAELSTSAIHLRLLLRSNAFKETFLDWQWRRSLEIRKLAAWQLARVCSIGIAGFAGIVLSTSAMPNSASASLIGMSSLLLLAGSAMAFGHVPQKVDPTRHKAVSSEIVNYSRLTKVTTVQPVSIASDPPLGDTGLRMTGVTFGFDNHVSPILSNVTLMAGKGQVFAITGAGPCGKSVLGRLAAGHYKPWSGRIEVDGIPVSRFDPVYLTESPVVLEGALEENLGSGLSNVTADDIARVISDLALETLRQRMRRCAAQRSDQEGMVLCQGEKQRVALACALAKNPRVLILDEALTSFDRAETSQILHTIRLRGIACLVLTNHWPVVQLCDEAAVLSNGILRSIGNPTVHSSMMECFSATAGDSI